MREHLEAINQIQAVEYIKDIASRLLMNLYLLRNGYILATLKCSNEDKISYYKALELSHADGDNTAFQTVVIRSVIASLERHLDIIGG